jgi:DNA-directed RNA polymerase
MLLFAKGKPLGEKGLDWLKIHLVNLTGMKKRYSNAERLQFADDSMQDVLDTADNPLTVSTVGAFHSLNLGTPCNFPVVYFGIFFCGA